MYGEFGSAAADLSGADPGLCPVERFEHGASAAWGARRTCLNQMPKWGQQAHLAGLSIYDVSLQAMELHVRPNGHIIEFACSHSASEISVNSDHTRALMIPQGSSFFAPAGSEIYRIGYAQPDAADRHDLLAVRVQPWLIDQMIGDLTDASSLNFADRGPPVFDMQIARAAAGLKQLMAAGSPVQALTVEALAHQIVQRALLRWSTLAQRIKPVRARHRARAVQDCIDYIQAHLTEAISLNDLVPISGLSIDTLTRLFKQSVGRTPYDYILEQRVELAKQRLEKTDDALSVIAVSCGFGSQSHFSTVFKKWSGTTPARYRRLSRV